MPPFARRGPSGRFPRVYARTAALRLPASPPRSLALARRFRHCCSGESGISLVPRRPSPRMPRFFDPGGTVGAGLRERVPTFGSAGVAFQACRPVGFHHDFLSGSDSAAYVLAVYASQPGSPLHHARLASGWRPCLVRTGVQPARSLRQVCTQVLASHGFLLTEASKSHGKIKARCHGGHIYLDRLAKHRIPLDLPGATV